MRVAVLTLVMVVVLPALGLAQSTLRLQWEIAGPPGPEGGPRPPFTVAMAQGYTYKLYRFNDPASGLALTMVGCSTTNDAFVKSCSISPVPMGYDTVGQSVDMTVTITGVESVHSNTAVVPPPQSPPGAPSNLRFIRTLLDVPIRAFGALREKVRGKPEPPPVFRFQAW